MNILFQNIEFVKKLFNDMTSDNGGTVNAAQLIVKTLSGVSKLQSLSIYKKSRTNFLERGIKQCTIFGRDVNVNAIVSGLIESRFCDRDEVLKFQHNVYNSLMSMEIKKSEREVEYLNSTAAKKRRLLKAITTDEVFKDCVNFLESRKVIETIDSGKRNEVLWRDALEQKVTQLSSIDKWLSMVSSISSEVPYEEGVATLSMLSLSKVKLFSIESETRDLTFSKTEIVSIDHVVEILSAKQNQRETENDSVDDSCLFSKRMRLIDDVGVPCDSKNVDIGYNTGDVGDQDGSLKVGTSMKDVSEGFATICESVVETIVRKDEHVARDVEEEKVNRGRVKNQEKEGTSILKNITEKESICNVKTFDKGSFDGKKIYGKSSRRIPFGNANNHSDVPCEVFKDTRQTRNSYNARVVNRNDRCNESNFNLNCQNARNFDPNGYCEEHFFEDSEFEN